ncbi:unnamed protein product [Echinostoma caproni]|uniref:Reverse transcriptase domain-containing protein n=1 Tax=Echinostoma caproni TaxID=27848 RepID=A0A183A974_9TREM|nr:unnamed protein product [Echinostoma caproni]
MDTIRAGILELERYSAQRRHVIDLLDGNEQISFKQFVNEVVMKRVVKKLAKLRDTLSDMKPRATLPTEPERYVHNFSRISVNRDLAEALLLGLDFCSPKRKDDQLEIEVQLENLHSQTSTLSAVSKESTDALKATLQRNRSSDRSSSDGFSTRTPTADIFMAKLENNGPRTTIDSLPFYCRYADDIFFLTHEKISLEMLLRKFNEAHAAITFTSEVESGDTFHFLDVNLKRRSDGYLNRSVYRKPTWTGQYIHFASFVPLKRNLVRSLAARARYVCSEESLPQELENIKLTLVSNGYPERFIQKNPSETPKGPPITTVNKKDLYMRLPYKEEHKSELIIRRLERAFARTFPAARLRLQFTSRLIISMNLKDKRPISTFSMITYSFVCSCLASYIARTIRQFSQRIKEHKPAWLSTGERKTMTSTIVEHLANMGHNVNEDAFKVIYRVPPYPPKAVRQQHLATAEAVAIRLFNPSLCSSKRFVKELQLPWPQSEFSCMAGVDSFHDPLTFAIDVVPETGGG